MSAVPITAITRDFGDYGDPKSRSFSQTQTIEIFSPLTRMSS
jgi:hypothetical protein